MSEFPARLAPRSQRDQGNYVPTIDTGKIEDVEYPKLQGGLDLDTTVDVTVEAPNGAPMTDHVANDYTIALALQEEEEGDLVGVTAEACRAVGAAATQLGLDISSAVSGLHQDMSGIAEARAAKGRKERKTASRFLSTDSAASAGNTGRSPLGVSMVSPNKKLISAEVLSSRAHVERQLSQTIEEPSFGDMAETPSSSNGGGDASPVSEEVPEFVPRDVLGDTRSSPGYMPYLLREEKEAAGLPTVFDPFDGDPLQQLLRDLRTSQRMRVADLKLLMEAATKLARGGDPTKLAVELHRVDEILKTVEHWDKTLLRVRKHLSQCQPPTVKTVTEFGIGDTIGLLEAMVEAWEALEDVLQRSQAAAQGRSAGFEPSVELGLDQRAKAAATCANALFDRAFEQVEVFGGAPHETPPYDFYLLCRRFERIVVNKTSRDALGRMTVPLPQSILEGLRRYGNAHDVTKQKEPDPTPDVTPGAFWQAVTSGDVDLVERFCEAGKATARSRDTNGHTAFWDALAFQRTSVATYLFKRFPPGSPAGVWLDEIHASRGDGLLHLLCYFDNFDAPVAELAELVMKTVPEGMLRHANQKGQNFLYVAACNANFWILSTCLSRGGPDLSRELFGALAHSGRSACQALAESSRVQAAVDRCGAYSTPGLPASAAAWAPLPRHISLPLDTGEGRPAFADVEFRVGGGVVWGHAVVLAAVSAVLHQELLRVEVAKGVRVVHVDAAVSHPEVLRFVLGVCYGRAQGCPFTSASHLWELLYLVLRYELPRQLRSLTIQALHLKLPEDADTCAALLTRGTAVRIPWKIQLLAAHVLFSEGVGKPKNSGRVAALSTALDCLETAVFAPPVSQ
mmetsp:Transcript_75918/g.173815  ORF Transcript_75918/g.173815 Transcript_75918/m.173815 type:complete len:852 (+) Transcript_75918:10-2565(+)